MKICLRCEIDLNLQKMRRITAFIPLTALLFACSSRLVKKEEIVRISKEYEKVYVLKEKIDVGNFDSLNKGAKVRIFFKTSGDYVSIYAYPYSQPREEAVGKNILQLFESDFPNKKFSEQVLRERIAALLEEYKGNVDKLPKQASFDTDLQRGNPQPAKGGGRPAGGARGRRGR